MPVDALTLTKRVALYLPTLVLTCLAANLLQGATTSTQPAPEPVIIPNTVRIITDNDTNTGTGTRPTTPGSATPVVLDNPPDVLSVRVGNWDSPTPSVDVFNGAFDEAGQYLGVEIIVRGLVNPPGPTESSYMPNKFGPNPIYGYLEFDIDNDPDSGGTVDDLAFRYNANAARFGGHPAGARFQNRIALAGIGFDDGVGLTLTVERTGEEFHLALLGPLVYEPGIRRLAGNVDTIFGCGETWLVPGRFFNLAHGFEGNLITGTPYNPMVTLRFRHTLGMEGCGDPRHGTTAIFMVYPLTNEAYVAMNTNDPGPVVYDGNPNNQNSVLEALTVLHDSAVYTADNDGDIWSPMIIPWANLDATGFLIPSRWDVNLLVGAVSPTLPVAGAGTFIWSDLWPNVLPGDFNGDGLANLIDRDRLQQFITTNDRGPIDENSADLDRVVVIRNFGLNFSIFDIDYDGVVGYTDSCLVWPVFGDFDCDGDIDLDDFAAFDVCYTGDVDASGSVSPASRACAGAFDHDGDDDIDLIDCAAFQNSFTWQLSSPN